MRSRRCWKYWTRELEHKWKCSMISCLVIGLAKRSTARLASFTISEAAFSVGTCSPRRKLYVLLWIPQSTPGQLQVNFTDDDHIKYKINEWVTHVEPTSEQEAPFSNSHLLKPLNPCTYQDSSLRTDRCWSL